MAEEVVLMKGNEAIAHAAIRCGADGYFGYPITPQSEVLETLAELKPWETTGMVVLQAESEVAAINMVYGGAVQAAKMVPTSSISAPASASKQEGISYIAGAELPCLIVNVMRGGPGLGTIQPSQADYFQTVKGGGHGDYRLIALAPASVQEMADFVSLGLLSLPSSDRKSELHHPCRRRNRTDGREGSSSATASRAARMPKSSSNVRGPLPAEPTAASPTSSLLWN